MDLTHKHIYRLLCFTFCIIITIGITDGQQENMCGQPMAIAYCLESSMSRNVFEQRGVAHFLGELNTAFTSFQKQHLLTAINYCAYVQEYVDITPSPGVVNNFFQRVTWQYHYSNPSMLWGAPGYGTTSVLAPSTSSCLRSARLSLGQVPSTYSKLIVLVTSGFSANPLETMNQAAAAKMEGIRIYGITKSAHIHSQEFRRVTSGPAYSLSVPNPMGMSTREKDIIIKSVCNNIYQPGESLDGASGSRSRSITRNIFERVRPETGTGNGANRVQGSRFNDENDEFAMMVLNDGVDGVSGNVATGGRIGRNGGFGGNGGLDRNGGIVDSIGVNERGGGTGGNANNNAGNIDNSGINGDNVIRDVGISGNGASNVGTNGDRDNRVGIDLGNNGVNRIGINGNGAVDNGNGVGGNGGFDIGINGNDGVRRDGNGGLGIGISRNGVNGGIFGVGINGNRINGGNINGAGSIDIGNSGDDNNNNNGGINIGINGNDIDRAGIGGNGDFDSGNNRNGINRTGIRRNGRIGVIINRNGVDGGFIGTGINGGVNVNGGFDIGRNGVGINGNGGIDIGVNGNDINDGNVGGNGNVDAGIDGGNNGIISGGDGNAGTGNSGDQINGVGGTENVGGIVINRNGISGGFINTEINTNGINIGGVNGGINAGNGNGVNGGFGIGDDGDRINDNSDNGINGGGIGIRGNGDIINGGNGGINVGINGDGDIINGGGNVNGNGRINIGISGDGVNGIGINGNGDIGVGNNGNNGIPLNPRDPNANSGNSGVIVGPRLPETNANPRLPGTNTNPRLPGTNANPRLPGTNANPRLPGTNTNPRLPGTNANPRLPGTNANPRLPGTNANPRLPGTNANPRLPGTNANPRLPGINANPRLPGTNANPRLPGTNANPRPSGTNANPRLPGTYTNPRLPGTNTNPRLPGINANPRLPGTNANPRLPGTNANPRPSGTNANPRPPGTNANPRPSGTNANPRLPGTNANPRLPGTNANPRPSGTNANPRLPGTNANPRLPGTNANPRLPGTNANPRLPGTNTNPRLPGTNANPRVPGINTNPRVPGTITNPRVPGTNTNPRQPGTNTNPRVPGINGNRGNSGDSGIFGNPGNSTSNGNGVNSGNRGNGVRIVIGGRDSNGDDLTAENTAAGGRIGIGSNVFPGLGGILSNLGSLPRVTLRPNVGGNNVAPCVDLRLVTNPVLRNAIRVGLYPRKECWYSRYSLGKYVRRTNTAVDRLTGLNLNRRGNNPPPVVPQPQGVSCVNLKDVTSPLLRQYILYQNRPRPACSESVASVSTTSSPNEGQSPPSTSQPCVDLSPYPPFLRAAILLINYPRQACDEANRDITIFPITPTAATVAPASTTASGSETALPPNEPCIDLERYPIQLRPIILQLNYPRRPCSDFTTTAAPTTASPTPPCIDLSEYAPFLRKTVLLLNSPREACNGTLPEIEPTTTSAPETNSSETTCINLDGFPLFIRPALLAMNWPRLACESENSDNETISTTEASNYPVPSAPSSTTPEPGCIDLSGVPKILRQGVLLLNWPRPECNVTNNNNQTPNIETTTQTLITTSESTSETTTDGAVTTTKLENATEPCINLAPYPAFLRPAILLMNRPLKECDTTSTDDDQSTTSLPETTTPLSTTILTTTPTETENATLPCINLEPYPAFLRPTILLLNRSRKPCNTTDNDGSITTPKMVTAAPSTTPETSPLPCIDISYIPPDQRPAIIEAMIPLQPCPLPSSTTETNNNQENSGTTSPFPCIDISYVPIEQRAEVVKTLKPLVPCPIALRQSTGTAAPTTSAPTSPTTDAINNADPVTPSGIPCFDITIFPESERAAIIEFMDPIQPCPFTTTAAPVMTTRDDVVDNSDDTTVANGNNQGNTLSTTKSAPTTSLPCVDISGFPESERAQAIEFIKPLKPCPIVLTENTGPTMSPTPVPTTPTTITPTLTTSQPLPCINLEGVSAFMRPVVLAVNWPRKACPPGTQVSTTSAPTSPTTDVINNADPVTPSGIPCFDITIFPESERAAIIEFMDPIQPCPFTTTAAPVMTTRDDVVDNSDDTTVANGNNQGNTLSTTTSAPTTSLPCVDISGFPESERAQAIEFIKPLQPCPIVLVENTGPTMSPTPIPTTPTTITPTLTTSQPLPCINLEGVSAFMRPVVLAVNWPRKACPPGTAAPTTSAPTSPTTDVINNADPVTPSGIPCFDITIFPESERAAIIEFMDPIQPCPFTTTAAPVMTTRDDVVDNSDDTTVANGNNQGNTLSTTTSAPTTSLPCVDISGFPESERAQAIEFIKPLQPCPIVLAENTGPTMSPTPIPTTTSTITPTLTTSQPLPCINLEGVSAFMRPVVLAVNWPRKACPPGTTALTTSAPTSPTTDVINNADPVIPSGIPCFDITIFPESERAAIIEFMDPIQPCPFTTTAAPVMTTRDDVVDNSDDTTVANGNNQGNTLSTTTSAPTTSLPCVDISGFPESERAQAIEFIKPLQPCPIVLVENTGPTMSPTPVPTTPTTITPTLTTSQPLPCINLEGVSAFMRPVVLAVNWPRKACPPGTQASTTSAPTSPTTDAINNADPVTPSDIPCFDITIFPESERAAIIDFMDPVKPCPITTADQQITSTSPTTLAASPEPTNNGEVNNNQETTILPCIDISGYPDSEKPEVIEIIKPLQPCPEGTVTARSTTLSMTEGAVTAQNPVPSVIPSTLPCIDISHIPQNVRQAVVEAMTPLTACLISVDSTPTPSTSDTTGGADGGNAPTRSCVDLSMFPELLRSRIAEVLTPLVICPVTVVTTPGSVLTTTSLPCVNLEGVSAFLRPVVLAINWPKQPCPEETETSTPSTITTTSNESGDGGSDNGSGGSGGIGGTGGVGYGIGNLCDGCFVVGDVGYNPSPFNCSSFVLCSRLPSFFNWTHDIVNCSPGLFWSQTLLSCVQPEQSDCLAVTCKDSNSTEITGTAPSCPLYYQCDNGTLYSNCCPSGQALSDGQCATGDDTGCPGLCLGGDETRQLSTRVEFSDVTIRGDNERSTQCHINRAVDSDQRLYETITGDGSWVVSFCPVNTLFDNETCSCVLDPTLSNLVLPPFTQTGCDPVFNLTVENEQLIDHAQSLWVASRNAFIDENACFNPRNSAHLLVPALNNFDYGDRVAISVTFQLGENYDSNQTAILGNCAPDTRHNASVYIGVERDFNGDLFVTGSIITYSFDNPFKLRLPISTAKTTVDFVYTGSVFYLAVGDDVVGVSARGQLPRLQSDLLIGYPITAGDEFFDGCIHQVLLTKCSL